METELEKPESMRITVSLEGLFDVNPIPQVRNDYRIRRKLTADEQKVYNDFMAVLGEYLGKEIELRRDNIYPELCNYRAVIYGKEGRQLYVNKYYGDVKVYYSSNTYCPRRIHAWDYHTMNHKDIRFTWTYGRTEQRDIMNLTREYHGYGNGSYYLYSVSQHVVFYREDD